MEIRNNNNYFAIGVFGVSVIVPFLIKKIKERNEANTNNNNNNNSQSSPQSSSSSPSSELLW